MSLDCHQNEVTQVTYVLYIQYLPTYSFLYCVAYSCVKYALELVSLGAAISHKKWLDNIRHQVYETIIMSSIAENIFVKQQSALAVALYRSKGQILWGKIDLIRCFTILAIHRILKSKICSIRYSISRCMYRIFSILVRTF